ncbi:MAG: hypothetical protein EAX90_06850, partial [Candidatus Heimdallarchaeota archaeon]|nr:hypothetical protein [Candidatus Heimdallarchaeota archaeon]
MAVIKVEKEILLDVLKRYNKEIIHMRQELNEKYRRFSLVCGAGIGKDLGFPKWDEFVLEIAKHKEIEAFDMAKNEIDKNQSLPKVTQMLYHIYLEKHLDEKKTLEETDFRFQLRMKANWIELVHGILYKNVPKLILDIKKADNYLQNFLPVIKKSKVTINYNFDDTLERLINDFITEAEKLDGKGYITTMSSNVK